MAKARTYSPPGRKHLIDTGSSRLQIKRNMGWIRVFHNVKSPDNGSDQKNELGSRRKHRRNLIGEGRGPSETRAKYGLGRKSSRLEKNRFGCLA